MKTTECIEQDHGTIHGSGSGIDEGYLDISNKVKGMDEYGGFIYREKYKGF